MNEFEEILGAALSAIAAGEDPGEVQSAIKQATGYDSIDALERAIDSGATPKGPTLRERFKNRELPGMGFGRELSHAQTLGLGDEIAGAVGGVANMVRGGSFKEGYREARAEDDALRQRYQGDHGLAALAAALLGGGSALPTTGAATLGRMVGHNAAVGAAYGAGEAEGGLLDRAVGGAKGGAIGGALGAAGRAAGAVSSSVRSALQKVPTMDELAESMAQRAGVPGGKIESAVRAAEKEVKRVSREAYRPLEEAFPAVDDADVLALVSGKKGGQTGAAIFRAAREVMGKDVAKRPPSFQELQGTLRRLRSLATKARTAGDPSEVQRYSQAAGELEAVMNARIPGFADAQAQYRLAAQARDAFAKGTRAWGRGSKQNRPEQIGEALAKLPDAAARENFRKGMLAAFYDEMSRRGGRVTMRQVEALQSAGMSARIRELFNTPGDYAAFMAELKKTGHVLANRERLKRGLTWLGAGSALAAGGSLFD